MPSKVYWFYLESYVYVSIKRNDLLLYNTLTGKFLAYYDRPRLREFLSELARKENLYVLKVTREFLRENGLEEFVEDLLEHFMGDLIDVALSHKQPFIMPPHLDIREEFDELRQRTFKNASRDSIFSLHEITIYVNGRCHHNCPACPTAFKQFPWCTGEDHDNELTLADIKEILDQVKGNSIKTIDIMGGDLTRYPNFPQLVELLCSYPVNVNYYFHYTQVKSGLPGAIQAGGPKAKTIVLVDCSTLTRPGDFADLQELEGDRMIFLIQREEEIEILEGLIDALKTKDFKIQPYFNRHNLDFFKTNVFTGYENLAEKALEMRAIQARRNYNTRQYGRLFIRSDKSIYSDVNGEPLGRLGEISLETAVILELTEQGNWLTVRRHVEPCKDCLFDTLCPPLANFEIATGINNSCNIREGQEALK